MLTQETRSGELARRLGTPRGNELAVGGVPVAQLARRFGTPLYIYAGDVIVEQVRSVQQAMGPETMLVYSAKANPSLGVCQLLAWQGIGVEVASIGELILAREAGFPAAGALFAGPGKTDAELLAAVRWGVLAVNAESAGELERLGRIAARAGAVARAAVRVNPASPIQAAGMRMGGGPQQFGIDEEALPEVLDRFRNHPDLRLTGLHVYAGTQVFDAKSLIEHSHHVVDLAIQMAEQLGRPLEVVDFGGGFGVPYFEGLPEFDLETWGSGYREVVRRCKEDDRLVDARLVVELGRYLVAGAGIYVTRVVDVKVSRGRTFVVTDGGMNHHITATGNFGQLFRKPYPLAVAQKLDASPNGLATITGPCCTPLDVLAQQVPFPEVAPGDLVIVFYSGAYGYSASSLSFLSHPTPAEVLVSEGRAHLLRDAGRPDGVLDGQHALCPAINGDKE